tara:strand:- start:1493 stop:2377 length:885 start_codon:yes stop_codon:yes gene_type:complete
MIVLTEFDEKYKINKKRQRIYKNRLRVHLLMDSAFKIQHAWRKKTNKLHIHIKKRIQSYTRYIYTPSYDWSDYQIKELLKNDLRCKISINMRIYKTLFSIEYIEKKSSNMLIKYMDKTNKEKDESHLKVINSLIENNNMKIKSLSVECNGMIANAIFNLKYIGVYYKSFLQSKEREKYIFDVKNRYKERGFKLKYPSKNYWWNRYSMFFICRYINHFIISILLIYKLSVNSYSTTVLFISISSIVCYFINIIVYNYIRYWIGTKSNSDPVYRKPFINIKCNCKKKEISVNTVNV